MTTMFVQLRRVVYLLVLLQCCVCAASPSGAWRGYPTAGSTELRKADQIRKVDQVLRGRVAKAYEHIALISGCLSAIGEEMKLCGEASRRAVAVAKNIKAITKEFEGMKKKNGEDWEPFVWIGRNTDKIVKNINEFGAVRLSLSDMFVLENTCKHQVGDLDEVMERLADARKDFLKVHKDDLREGPEVMKLDEDSRKANQMLIDLAGRLGAEDGELEPLANLIEVMGDTSRAVEALKQSLGDETELVAILEAMKDEELRKKAEERKAAVTNKLKEAKAKAKEGLPQVQEVQEVPVEEEEGEKRKSSGRQRWWLRRRRLE